MLTGVEATVSCVIQSNRWHLRPNWGDLALISSWHWKPRLAAKGSAVEWVSGGINGSHMVEVRAPPVRCTSIVTRAKETDGHLRDLSFHQQSSFCSTGTLLSFKKQIEKKTQTTKKLMVIRRRVAFVTLFYDRCLWNLTMLWRRPEINIWRKKKKKMSLVVEFPPAVTIIWLL